MTNTSLKKEYNKKRTQPARITKAAPEKIKKTNQLNQSNIYRTVCTQRFIYIIEHIRVVAESNWWWYQCEPLWRHIFFLNCLFEAIICPNKVWKLKYRPCWFKILTSQSREGYYSLISLVGISSRCPARFGMRKYVSF